MARDPQRTLGATIRLPVQIFLIAPLHATIRGCLETTQSGHRGGDFSLTTGSGGTQALRELRLRLLRRGDRRFLSRRGPLRDSFASGHTFSARSGMAIAAPPGPRVDKAFDSGRNGFRFRYVHRSTPVPPSGPSGPCGQSRMSSTRRIPRNKLDCQKRNLSLMITPKWQSCCSHQSLCCQR